MKKLVVKIILVILIITLGSKAYYFMVMNHICRAIERFENEENRYYSVVLKSKRSTGKQEIWLKDNVLKLEESKDGEKTYCQWEDFSNGKKYNIDLERKDFTENVLTKTNKNYLVNLPRLILNIYKDNQFKMKYFLKIKYIIPIKYNNQKCYKIVTNQETIIVDRTTGLPIHSVVKFTNSNQDSKYETEISYEFKVNEVTDEEIELPDLTGYTKTNE